MDSTSLDFKVEEGSSARTYVASDHQGSVKFTYDYTDYQGRSSIWLDFDEADRVFLEDRERYFKACLAVARFYRFFWGDIGESSVVWYHPVWKRVEPVTEESLRSVDWDDLPKPTPEELKEQEEKTIAIINAAMAPHGRKLKSEGGGHFSTVPTDPDQRQTKKWWQFWRKD